MVAKYEDRMTTLQRMGLRTSGLFFLDYVDLNHDFLDYFISGLLPFRLKYAKSKEAKVEQVRMIIYLKTCQTSYIEQHELLKRHKAIQCR